MARRVSKLIGTLVLILCSTHLINCPVSNLEPVLLENSLDRIQGPRIWTFPKEDMSDIYGSARYGFHQSELPWYVLIPLVILVAGCEIQVMLDVLKAQELARDKETAKMYRKLSLLFVVEEKKEVVDAKVPEEEKQEQEVEEKRVTKKKGIHPRMPFRKARKQRSAQAQAKRH